MHTRPVVGADHRNSIHRSGLAFPSRGIVPCHQVTSSIDSGACYRSYRQSQAAASAVTIVRPTRYHTAVAVADEMPASILLTVVINGLT